MKIKLKQPNSNFHHVLLISIVIFLLFFRAKYGLRMYGAGDDACYLSYLGRILGTSLSECGDTLHAPGTIFIWLPLALITRLFTWIFNSDFKTWVVAGIGLSTYFFWTISLYFLYDLSKDRIASLLGDKWWTRLLPLAMIASSPLLYYITNRTSMAHGAEFFFSILFYWLMMKNRYYLAFFSAVLLLFTRYNNAPVIAVIFARMLDLRKSPDRSSMPDRYFILFYSAFFCIVGAFIAKKAFISGYSNNGMGTFQDCIRNVDLFGNPWTYFTGFMTNASSGYLWTGGFWVLTFHLGLLYIFRLSWVSRIGLLWMFLNMIISLNWRGGDFGYRYLIGTYAPAIMLWLELAEMLKKKKWFRWLSVSVIAFNSLWSLWLVWIIKTLPQVTFWIIANGSWGNPTLQIEALKLLANPVAALRPLALSPVPSIIYSWFLPDHPVFQKYALDRAPLVLLTIVVTAMLIYLYSRLKRIKKPV
ncbi:MAG: hypothetical protein HQK54_17390 [Oligoflexales bacterium]|nr:hypothetical protein [Oligoflexales bacterium]